MHGVQAICVSHALDLGSAEAQLEQLVTSNDAVLKGRPLREALLAITRRGKHALSEHFSGFDRHGPIVAGGALQRTRAL